MKTLAVSTLALVLSVLPMSSLPAPTDSPLQSRLVATDGTHTQLDIAQDIFCWIAPSACKK